MLIRVNAEPALPGRDYQAAPSQTGEAERYRNLVEQAADGIFIADHNGLYLEVNQSGCRMLGMRRDEVVGRHIRDIIAESDHHQHAVDFELVRAGQAIVRERLVRRGDGSLFPAEVSVKRLSDGRYQGILRDISERKRAEAALRAGRQRLSLILENTSDVFALYEVDGIGRYRLVEVNASFLTTAGRRVGKPITAEMVLGRSFDELLRDVLEFEPASIERSRKHIDEAVSTGRTIRWEEASQRKTDFAHSERTDVPILDANGRCGHVLRVVHDITDQKLVEDALRASEQRFRSYFELPLIGVAISSPTRAWIEVNDGLCAMLGYPRYELLTKTWAEITHPDDLAANEANFARALAGQCDGYTMEKRFIKKDGSVVHTALSARCVRGTDRSIKYFATLVQDMTSRKTAELERERALASEQKAHEDFTRRLIESQEAERRRIAGELHDSLGQNLLLIKNRARLALATPDAHAAAQQLESIAELASLSIAEVRQISHDLRPYQLDQLGLTRALESMIESAAQSTGVVFTRKVENIDHALSTDAATNLYRVVQEGLNNVIKHSGAQAVRIEIERDIREIRLLIEDNGRGLDLSRPSRGTASGFGLQNIGERVRLLGGSLNIVSRPGAGVRLEIVIPAMESA